MKARGFADRWGKERANVCAVLLDEADRWAGRRQRRLCPSLPEGLCSAAVTTLDSTSCHSGREQSQDTLACHSLFCTRAEGGGPKTGRPDGGRLTLLDTYT